MNTRLRHQAPIYVRNQIENDKICLLKAGKKTANINVKKLQFMPTVNGDRRQKS